MHLKTQYRRPKFGTKVTRTKKLTKLKVKIPNSNQEPPASPKAQIQVNKDMRVLCTFKLNIETQNWEQRFLGPNYTYQIPSQEPISNQEPPASSTSPIQGNKDMRHLCIFKLNIENSNSEQRFLGPKQTYQNPS